MNTDGVIQPKLTRAILGEAVIELSARDAGLADIVARLGHPPMWARPHGFATLVRIILEQQVSLQSAATLYKRLEVGVGGMTPASVLHAGDAGLRQHGLTRQKARFVFALAEQVESGALRLDTLPRRPDADVSAALMCVPGIGPWSAGIYLLMVLRRPDVWPPGDLALHKALQHLHRLPVLPRSDEATRIAEQWSPWRAVAARLLWHDYLSSRGRS